MSIYNRPISQLTEADLQELLDDAAVENIRLEFKREWPKKDEALKKLSSLANTYGGYVIIGAAADNSGKLDGMSGVETESGTKQRIVQWCYDSISPPIQPFVSDSIRGPSDKTKVCYVVFVEESEEAPHFINSRRGAWIRTDEFSQRFEPQLTTYQEIQHLANRRRPAVERRRELVKRADGRFETYVRQKHPKHDVGATLKLAICPSLPVRPLLEQQRLLDVVQRVRVAPWRGVGFPMNQSLLSQHESAIILNTGADFSLLEANTWGQIYYALEIERDLSANVPNAKGFHLNSLVAHILVALEHARLFYSDIGYDGSLGFHLCLERIRGVPFWHGLSGFPEKGPESPLDDQLEFDAKHSSEAIYNNRDEIAASLPKGIVFGLNWPDAAQDRSVEKLIREAYNYNGWQ